MAVLELVNYGNPILRKTCSSVKDFSKLADFIDNMFDTMYKFNGVGLAAPQIGKSIKMLVIDCSKTDEKFFPKTLINPKILEI